ncbi:T9SS type A sorting domain-containing protein [Algoriphagus pacificus]|uniref:Metallophosphoesterase n=1 Tax=Algoriphagus pacificus TaxID=2811234 RepID=A0ABS3CJ59_9BACT|nr:T9SS type A sorting domain-containing protein [Algoriphagus pacificus]MBN7816196.1 metallophosphoesterase [Algoriphagus pacificus]
MTKRILFLVFAAFFFGSAWKFFEVNPFRIYPYLQFYNQGKVQITWFSNSLTSSSIKVLDDAGNTILSKSVEGKSMPELYYTNAEKNQVLVGLEQGSWIGSEESFKYQVQITLPPNKAITYTVELGGQSFSSEFKSPPSRDNWDKIRFFALADSETDPRGRVTNRAWYPGTPLFRPITTVPELWKQKFGSTVEQGIELPNYMLTEEVGYAENLKIINNRNPDFIVMPGDLVQGAGYLPGWDEFFRQNAGEKGKGLSKYAIIPALGNWESYGAINGGYGTNERGAFLPVLSRSRFHAYFETPVEDPLQKHRQSYFRADYGPITVLTIDSSNGTPDQTAADFEGQTKLKGKEYTVPGTDTQENYTESQYKGAGGNDLSSFGPGSAQYEWLESNLKEANESGQLIFVQYHHIAFSSGEHGVPLNHELSIGQVGTPLRVLNPLLEQYGVIAVFSGHDELFERSFVDEDGDGKGIMYYDVGVAGDGMRGEKRDWLGNPLNTLDYNPYRKWTADQSEPEIWDTSGANPVLVDGGKHYGHLEVNLEKISEGSDQFALINFTPVYAFPVLDQNYNLVKVERRVYKDEIQLKIPLRTSEAAPVFKENLTVKLGEDGNVTPAISEYFISGYSADYTYDLSRSSTYSCADLGLKEVILKVKSEGVVKWEGVIKVTVVDDLKPSMTLKEFKGTLDVTAFKQFEIKREHIIASVSDNCGDDLEIIYSPKTIGCEDLNQPIKVEVTVKDKSGNSISGSTTVTIEKTESKKISLQGPGTATEGSEIKLELGSEFSYQVLGWYKGEDLISTSDSKILTVTQSGVYKAKILPTNGCPVFSAIKEVSFSATSEKPYPAVKEKVELVLNENGKAELSISKVFTSTPSGDLIISFSQTLFTCEDLGENPVTITIKDTKGKEWTEQVLVIVQDNSKPVLVTKNIEIEFDLTKGEMPLKAADFLISSSDNCGIKELTINKTSLNCESVGKEIQVEVRAVDFAGNVSEKTAIVKVKGYTSSPVVISGPQEICIGTNQTLTLQSDATFEVVRWRRNGVEISGQTGKELLIEEGGVYHAVIRYAGGCLFESEKLEVKTLQKPTGEIVQDGNILRAPEGFQYQWYRNGELIPGETKRAITLNQMGIYTVEITNEAGCKSKLGPIEVTISGILPSEILSRELKIYPNPVESEVLVEATGDLEFETNSWQVYDLNGKNVSGQIKLLNQSATRLGMEISSLANGTYIITVNSTDNSIFLGRIVKVK